MEVKVAAIVLTLASCISAAQVPAPRHESLVHHLFAAHRDGDNLPQRFNELRCALVLIQAGPRLGTGFFINADGDIATASHVLGDRQFQPLPNGQMRITILMPNTFTLTDSSGKKTDVPATSVETNPDAWLSDVARIRSGIKTSCWLREEDDQKVRPGEHLLVMGFPGLSFQALTMYSGIMSARLKSNLPSVILPNGMALQAPNEFIRVQMPISTGLSGAPLIDDDNRAIGVITQAGGWTQDLENLVMLFRGGAFKTPPPPPSANQPPNSVAITLNAMATTAELAGLFHDFASPGYGDAVPLRYLRLPQQQNQPPASRSH